MNDYTQARVIAEECLDREVRWDTDEEVIIVERGILETPTAWIFPYDSRIYLETRDTMHALVGNGPVVVPKDGTKPWMPFNGPPIEEQIADIDQAKVVFGRVD